MKKALLIYRIHRDDPGNTGVIKKIDAQTNAFRKLGFETDKVWLCRDGMLLNETLVHRKKLQPHSLAIYRFYFFRFAPLIRKLVRVSQYDFIYLRHPFFDPLLVRFLKNIKKDFPKIRIILEINTYPYDAEPKRLLHRISLKMDRHFRRFAHRYVDRVVHYGQEAKIWNIPVINIRNGIEAGGIPISGSKTLEGELRLIAVGNWSYWHGLDRLIKGLGNYYRCSKNKTKISLKIVGDGRVKAQLIKLADDLDLTGVVQFAPATKGVKLDRLFEQADVGIGTLGLHRKGVKYDSSLKHREYCSRGLPFILSAPDLDFPKVLPFVYAVPADETDLDLESFLPVYARWQSQAFRQEIRNYAETHLSWEKQLSPIRQWLYSELNR